jgi:hypothetical protein
VSRQEAHIEQLSRYLEDHIEHVSRQRAHKGRQEAQIHPISRQEGTIEEPLIVQAKIQGVHKKTMSIESTHIEKVSIH